MNRGSGVGAGGGGQAAGARAHSAWGRPPTWRDRRRKLVNAIMLTLTGVAAVATVVPLVLILWHLLEAGLTSLGVDFFTHMPAPPGETGGGMANGLAGTFLIVAVAAAMGIPIAVGAGVYLAERDRSRVAMVVRFIADVMNGIPSIVVGIFVWAWIVVAMGHFSAFAGSVALAIMLIPMVTRTTEEMVRLVPSELREGGLALGASRWRTTLSIILPAARRGIVTGVLVALARIAGETAPLLFTTLGNNFWTLNPGHPMAALPLQIFNYAISPYDDWHRQAWAAALVLIAVVLLTSIAARFAVRER